MSDLKPLKKYRKPKTKKQFFPEWQLYIVYFCHSGKNEIMKPKSRSRGPTFLNFLKI